MKRLFFVLFALMSSVLLYSQENCGYGILSEEERWRAYDPYGYGNIGNGGVFTPKGDIRILIVFVTLDDPYDTCNLDGWPLNSRFSQLGYRRDLPVVRHKF